MILTYSDIEDICDLPPDAVSCRVTDADGLHAYPYDPDEVWEHIQTRICEAYEFEPWQVFECEGVLCVAVPPEHEPSRECLARLVADVLEDVGPRADRERPEWRQWYTVCLIAPTSDGDGDGDGDRRRYRWYRAARWLESHVGGEEGDVRIDGAGVHVRGHRTVTPSDLDALDAWYIETFAPTA